MIEFWHNIGDNWTYLVHGHDSLWLHMVVHIVLVITPASLFFILLYGIYKAVVLFRRKKQQESHDSITYLPLSLFSFIKKFSYRNQIILICASLFTLPVTYAGLELPKQIINNAISEVNFQTSTASIYFNQIDYLLLLCALYLIVLIINGGGKYFVNYYKGAVSELLIFRLRRYLVRKKSTPLEESKNNDALVPIIIQEVEPVCGFSGDAFAVPLLQGGGALTIITFMMVQNPVLGIAAITLLPIQIIVIPKFQRKINRLVRERVLAIRKLSDHIVANNNTEVNSQEISSLFSLLYKLRLRLFKLKFSMKSLNNFIMNLTPFFFYTIGGYLVIDGKLSLGALVASLTSYKDLASSIRELFTYYQSLQDSKIRYAEILNYTQARDTQ